jgi:hypothetical protein
MPCLGLLAYHSAEIKSGKVTCRIVGMPDRDFPRGAGTTEASYATIESAVLRELSSAPCAGICGGRRWFHRSTGWREVQPD